MNVSKMLEDYYKLREEFFKDMENIIRNNDKMMKMAKLWSELRYRGLV